MKKELILWLTTPLLAAMLAGCSPNTDTPKAIEPTPTPVYTMSPAPSPAPSISSEERKRMDLYIAAMRGAFAEENGGDGFIAIDLDTLEGLGDQAEAQVLEAFRDLSDDVYDLTDIETDETRFYMYENGGEEKIDGTKDGTVLSVRVEAYTGDHAVIGATSWFGSLGAVFPEYHAIYENDTWNLELVSMAVS